MAVKDTSDAPGDGERGEEPAMSRAAKRLAAGQSTDEVSGEIGSALAEVRAAVEENRSLLMRVRADIRAGTSDARIAGELIVNDVRLAEIRADLFSLEKAFDAGYALGTARRLRSVPARKSA
jgi:hypothetical protein